MVMFANVAELGDYTGESLDFLDARARLMLSSASAAIQNYVRQRIEFVEDDAVALRGGWEPVLRLPERPVIAVSEVSILGTVLGVDTYSWNRRGELTNGGPLNGSEHLTGHWGGPGGVVTVTYSHGYDTIPDDIKLVCLNLAARLMQNPAAVESERIGDYAVTYGDYAGARFTTAAMAMVGPREASVLNRYRERVYMS